MSQELTDRVSTPEEVAAISIVNDYFKAHPEAMDEVARATYAWSIDHQQPRHHHFLGPKFEFGWEGKDREQACIHCGQTREGIRYNWYGTPPQCQKRPKEYGMSIQGIVAKEEVRWRQLLVKATSFCKENDITAFSGEQLAKLHSEQGFDIEMLIDLQISEGKPLTDKQKEEYRVAREKEAAISRSRRKVEVIKCADSAILK